MKRQVMVVLAVLATIMTSHATFADQVLEKPPDQGAFWQPLGPDGSYIYANSFVALETGFVTDLGMWLQSNGGPGAGGLVSFDVYGSIGGDPTLGPDSQNVLASTGNLDIGGTDSLDFYNAGITASAELTVGETYWFGANAIGNGPGSGASYTVGGHTQNSVYQDDGTFWFSNDPTGIVFDGQNVTPEMAFRVTTTNIPEPASLGLIGLGVVALLRRRR